MPTLTTESPRETSTWSIDSDVFGVGEAWTSTLCFSPETICFLFVYLVFVKCIGVTLVHTIT